MTPHPKNCVGISVATPFCTGHYNTVNMGKFLHRENFIHYLQFYKHLGVRREIRSPLNEMEGSLLSSENTFCRDLVVGETILPPVILDWRIGGAPAKWLTGFL